MSHSFVNNLIHLVYATKHREPLLRAEIRADLFTFQANVFRDWQSPSLAIDGFDDHVHALFALSKNHPLKRVVEEVKKGSAKWLKRQSGVDPGFQWQAGYFAFSVSESLAPKVRQYIRNQQEHHQRTTFAEELRLLRELHSMG